MFDGYQRVGVGELVSISAQKAGRWWDAVGRSSDGSRSQTEKGDRALICAASDGASRDGMRGACAMDCIVLLLERSRGRPCRPALYIARIALFLVKAA